MPAYDEVWFDPPAPLARVSLRNPHNAEAVPDVPMLVDSGADVTLIPTTFAVQIGLHADAEESYELMAFDGSISTAPVVQLEMSFLRKTFRGRFQLIDQEWGCTWTGHSQSSDPLAGRPQFVLERTTLRSLISCKADAYERRSREYAKR